MNRQGKYKTNLSSKLEYSSFQPATLPLEYPVELTDTIMKLLMKSYVLLGKLDGISSKVPNKDIFVSMYVRKEALLSSQIEGTQATLEDIFDPSIEKNVNLDVQEVISYIKALQYANKRIHDLPISSRLIKEVHKVLLSSTRGMYKNPGEFRKSQNWIGSPGSTLMNCTYIPPNVEDMEQAVTNLEKYIHYEEVDDVLIKTALVHYQFETIHPFLDGNGRIGRLLINLMLKKNMLLDDDLLYISYYLKKNKQEYYQQLNSVRNKGTFESWIEFFLKGIVESCLDSIETIELLMSLQEESLTKIEEIGRSKETAIKALNYIERKPLIDINELAKGLQVTFKTASNVIAKLVELGILVQINKKSRYRIYAYEKYLNILRKGT